MTKRSAKDAPDIDTDDKYCLKKLLTRGEKVCAFIERYCVAPDARDPTQALET